MLNRLSHINPAIILSASKVILKFSKSLENQKIVDGLCKKIANSLLSIMGRSPEIVWVFLRNIEIIISQYPLVVTNVKAFFVNFNDPCFVKMQKVQILGLLCDEHSVKMIVTELSEYSYDTNVEFSRFAFQTLWKIAAKYETALEPVMKSISQILANSQDVGFIDHLINEAAVACENLYRRYQNTSVLIETYSFIANSHARINKTESVCAVLNILPEMNGFVREAYEIIYSYVENFLELGVETQLALLSSVIKLFTIDVSKYQNLVQVVLETIDKNIDLPDLRDRAFIYWRLLDLNPAVAKSVVMGPRAKISYQDANAANKPLFDSLFDRIGGISATLQDNYFSNEKSRKLAVLVNNLDEVKLNRENDLLQLEVDEQPVVEAMRTVPGKHPANDQTSVLNLEFGLMSTQPTNQPSEPSKKLELLISEFPVALSNPLSVPLNVFEHSKRPSYEDNQDKYSSFNLLNLDVSSKPSIPQPVNLLSVAESKQTTKEIFNFEFDSQIAKVQKAKRNIKVEYKNNKSSDLIEYEQKGKKGISGIEMKGSFQRNGQLLFLSMVIENKSQSVLSQMQVLLKPNLFGLVLRQTEIETEIFAGSFEKVDLPIGFDMSGRLSEWNMIDNAVFDVELESNIDTWEFRITCQLNNVLVELLAFFKND